MAVMAEYKQIHYLDFPLLIRHAQSAAFHIYTIWLFTFSDLKTIVIPSTVFAVVTSLAAYRLGLVQQSLDLPYRIPYVVLWSWINLLPFNINNQIRSDAVLEDAENKPWRPLPSERLRSSAATKLMFIFYGLALLSSIRLGTMSQCLTLVVLGWWYNEMNGADTSWLVRNLINGIGYLSFTSGALTVALKGDQRPIRDQAWWYAVVFLVLSTTIQCQDMYDQRGDAMRNRKTAPLVIGDGAARVSIAISVMSWSVIAPWLWRCSPMWYVPLVVAGGAVSGHSLTRRTISADKTTFRIWNLWLSLIFCLPLLSTFNVL
jgi:4-hydroxybenzoate polyprenyltransferase